MADEIRGYEFNTTDKLRDVNAVYVSGSINLEKVNYALLVVPANSDGIISADNPLNIAESYTRLSSAMDADSYNNDILKELKKMNMYLSLICGDEIKNEEIEV